MRSQFRSRHVRSLLTFSMLVACGPAFAEGPDAYLVETVADGVALFRPADDDGARANSLVVEQQAGLVVVGAQPSPAAARDLLAAIGARFDRPVTRLIVTHAHAESAGGASAFGASVILFASEGTLKALRDETYDFGAEIREQSTAPESWTPPPRRLPDVALMCKAELPDPTHPIHVTPQGPAHSQGDLFVYLPRQSVMHVGGILFSDGNPYARDANVEGWTARLNGVIAMSPEKIVGTNGPVLDAEAVLRQRNALNWVRSRVNEAFVEGTPRPDIRRFVLETERIEEHFAVDASPSFLPSLIDQAIEEALEHRRKRGYLPR